MTNTPMHSASPAAQLVTEMRAKHSRHMRRSSAIGIEKVLGDLGEVWVECRKSDWDGHGALRVSSDAMNYARKLLESLPLGFPHPSVGAEPDGQITLEWHCSPHRTLSISVSPCADLHYAALIGPARVCGTEPFFEDFPQTLFDLIGRIYH